MTALTGIYFDKKVNLPVPLDTMVKQCKGTNYPIDKCPIIDALYA